MASARDSRPSVRRRRARVLPTVSRLTVRVSSSATVAPPAAEAVVVTRKARLTDALRASREALGDLQKQLDALLAVVRTPAGRPEPDAADRLRRATKRAGSAMTRLASV